MIGIGIPRVQGSLKRQPQALAFGATAGYSTQIPVLNLWAPMGIVFQPTVRLKRPEVATDAFGVQLQQPAIVVADVPDASPQPILPNDILVAPDGTEYVVVVARAFVGHHIEILIEMAVP